MFKIKAYSVIILSLILLSCDKEKETHMELKNVDPIILETAERITKDYLSVSNSPSKFYTFKDKSYISKNLSRDFSIEKHPYNYTPQIFKNLLGDITNVELIKIQQLNNSKIFEYTGDASMQEKPIDYIIHLDEDNQLTQIELYLNHSFSGERRNLYKFSNGR